MGISVMKGRRFADTQESRIQAENRSKMGSAVPAVFHLLMLRNRLFRFEKFKCISAAMKGLRFADTQESRFQASKRSNMGSAVL